MDEVEKTLAFWEHDGGLKVGSRYSVPGLDALFDVLRIEEHGEELVVTVRDTVSWRPVVKSIPRTSRPAAPEGKETE